MSDQLSNQHLEVWLNRCFTDLTIRSEGAAARRAYGRDNEIAEILALLASPLPRHPVLLGRPGVGKTAVAHEILDLVRQGKCPGPLRGLRLLASSPRQLLNGLPPGDGWRAALPQLWEYLTRQQPFLLLFYNAHEAAGAGNRYNHEPDLASVLTELVQLAPGNSPIRILAEARTDRWNHLTVQVAAYTTLFVPIRLEEPEGERLAEVLELACGELELEHNVVVRAAARQRAVELTRRFVVNGALPGKALALLEESMAAQGGTTGATAEIGPGEVTARFAQRTGLPLMLLEEKSLWDEKQVRAHFQSRVLGQELALEAVVQRLGLLKASINDPNRPLGVFLFIGPTGVGKTELAKALANFLFGRDDRLVRINMADYTEPWQFRQLFGDPDPDEPIEIQRGQLTTRLGDHSFTVLLLDEFEKAYPNIFQRFLQLFDEGVLLNGAGEEVNLRNSIIILTSNLAANLTQQGSLGFLRDHAAESLEQRVLRTAEEYFTPELVNRIDQVVFFHPLSRAAVRQIAFREFEALFQREGIRRRRVEIELEDNVIDWILERGYSERFGARYLRRQIEKSISYPIARALVTQPVEPGSLLRVYVRGGAQGQIEATVIPPDEASGLAGELIEMAPQGSQVTLADVKEALPELLRRAGEVARIHRLEELRARRDELLAAMSRPDFWDEPEESQRLAQQLASLSARVELVDGVMRALEEAEALLEKIWGQSDRGKIAALARLYKQILAELERAELDLYFVDRFDPLDAWLTILAGGEAGEAAEWPAELARMYLAWARGRGFEAAIVDEAGWEESRTPLRLRVRIHGHGAFALLRGETGIHRLTEGIDDGGRLIRHARVIVWPQIPADQLPLSLAELNLEGGAISGRGSFLKRLRACVTIHHHQSGCAVECQSDKSLQETEALALELLRGCLVAEEAKLDRIPSLPGWGQVVRTYQRHREQGVKDLRTETVIKSLRHVLAGRIDPFLMAALAGRAAGARG